MVEEQPAPVEVRAAAARRFGPREMRRTVSAVTAGVRAARAVNSSGLFDAAWYRAQVPGGLDDSVDAVKHYVREGIAAGLSPNPLFSPRHYVDQSRSAARSTLGPFIHYLRRGAVQGLSPHPVFDVPFYLEQTPEALGHPGGALSHYLEVGWRQRLKINDWFSSSDYQERHPDAGVDEPAILHFLRRAQTWLAEVPDFRNFPRLYDEFDHERARRFKEDMQVALASSGRPLVSVVLPVRDRAGTVGAAIASVLAQSYDHLELIVVDDGSVDATPDTVASFDDPRIRLIRQQPIGVCRARNQALAAASGSYVAYLDSDNTWEPNFLGTMVAFLASTEHDVAYSALEIEMQGRRQYRGVPFDRSALLEANYIDCNTLVHERALADQIGGWDESLRRTNDWDFVIRITEVGRVGFAPFIGVRYDHDRERGDRISVREPFGFKFKVFAKHRFDWSAIAAQPETRGLTSIIVPVSEDGPHAGACLEALSTTTSAPDDEIIVVDNSTSELSALRNFEFVDRVDHARLVRPTWMRLHLPLTLAFGVAQARGDVIAIVDPALVVQPGWSEPLVATIREGQAVLAQGPILDWDGVVANAGYFIGANQLPTPSLVGFAEHAPELAVGASRQALCWSLLAARRSDLIAAQGLDPLFRGSLADADLTLRVREASSGDVRFVPGSGAALQPDVAEPDPRIVEEDQRVFSERWSARLVADEATTLDEHGLRVVRHEISNSRWAAIDSFEPIVEHMRERHRPLRWAIKIGPFDVGMRSRWGDWHFGLALRDALESLGHRAALDLRDGWYRRSSHLDDVVLVLRGNGRYRLNPAHLNLVWLISHPDMPSDDELSRYDHRFVASDTYARKLASRIGQPTDPLLQCTDPERFVPGPETDEAERVLFVGNSRGALRPIVGDALAAGLPIGVYGAHWKGRVPKHVWRAKFVPNDQLPLLYRSAGVVLNDHWEDMRREGFLSNRLFDLAACGANVVSDQIEGIREVFGDSVRTYDAPQELAGAVEDALSHRDAEAHARLQLASRMRQDHSFLARARELDRVARGLLAARDGEHGAGWSAATQP